MSRNEVVLQVMVASPSDLAPERQVLDDVISELNSVWSRKLGVRLELLLWETHARPGFSADAQQVINEQMPDDYDLFVGLMWARFGTPTGRAGSGTAEEFDRALSRFRKDPKSVQLMMYFKNAPLAPSDVDPQQLAAVQRFKARLETEGGLVGTFAGVDDFTELARIHITRFVQAWCEAREAAQIPSTREDAGGLPSTGATQDEEAGFVDLFETALENLNALSATLDRMTAITGQLAKDVQERAAEINNVKADRQNFSPSSSKRVFARLAEDMERFVRLSRVELAQFTRQFDDALTATGAIAPLALDFGAESAEVKALPQLANTIDGFATALRQTGEIMQGAANQMRATPRITTTYNRARRATIDVLDEVSRTLSASADTSLSVAAGMRSLTGGSPADATAGH